MSDESSEKDAGVIAWIKYHWGWCFAGFLFFVFIVVCWAFFPLLLGALHIRLFPEGLGDVSVLGSFGDMFGALGALATFCGFGAALVAVFLQRRELRLQRRELRLQRRELKLTREELELQREEMKLARAETKGMRENMERQSRDSTYFQLLSYHTDMVSRFSVLHTPPNSEGGAGTRRYEGQDAFGIWVNEFCDLLKGKRETSEFEAAYKEFWFAKTYISQYIRSLEVLFDRICALDATNHGNDRTIYLDALKSHIIPGQSWIILCHYTLHPARNRYKKFVDESGILEELYVDSRNVERSRIFLALGKLLHSDD